MATSETTVQLPKIEDGDAMPKARRGRVGMDLTPIVEKLKDLKPHAFAGIGDAKAKEKWARKAREAAEKAGLDVRTTYDPSSQKLWFQGFPRGEAPAQGRKKGSTRKVKAA